MKGRGCVRRGEGLKSLVEQDAGGEFLGIDGAQIDPTAEAFVDAGEQRRVHVVLLHAAHQQRHHSRRRRFQLRGDLGASVEKSKEGKEVNEDSIRSLKWKERG